MATKIWRIEASTNLLCPPRPGAAVIQPPPPRSLTPHPDGVSVVNAHSGDVGQYFGNFGPPHPQM